MKNGVYFVRSGAAGPIKIGYATDFAKRLVSLQCGNPERLVLRAFLVGPARLERQLHRALTSSLYRSEWFWPHHPIDALIDGINAGQITADNAVAWVDERVSAMRAAIGARSRDQLVNAWLSVVTDPKQPRHLIACCSQFLTEHGIPHRTSVDLGEADHLRGLN